MNTSGFQKRKRASAGLSPWGHRLAVPSTKRNRAAGGTLVPRGLGRGSSILPPAVFRLQVLVAREALTSHRELSASRAAKVPENRAAGKLSADSALTCYTGRGAAPGVRRKT